MKSQTCGPSVGQSCSPSSGTIRTAITSPPEGRPADHGPVPAAPPLAAAADADGSPRRPSRSPTGAGCGQPVTDQSGPPAAGSPAATPCAPWRSPPCGSRRPGPPVGPSHRRRSPGTRWPWAMPIPGATRLGLGGATCGRPGWAKWAAAGAHLLAAVSAWWPQLSCFAAGDDVRVSAPDLSRPWRKPPDPYTEKSSCRCAFPRPPQKFLTPLPPGDLPCQTAPGSRIGSVLAPPAGVTECLQVAPVVRAALRLWYDVIDRRGRPAALAAKRFLSEHLCPELQPVALVPLESAAPRPRLRAVRWAVRFTG